MTDCLFCKIVAGEVPSDKVHETETTLAFKDIHPRPRCTCSSCRSRHIDDASVLTAGDGPVLAEMFLAARAVADEAGLATPERGYRLVFNVGPDAMNSVPAPPSPRPRRRTAEGHLLNS